MRNELHINSPALIVDEVKPGTFNTIVFPGATDLGSEGVGILFADMIRTVATSIAKDAGGPMGMHQDNILRLLNAEMRSPTRILKVTEQELEND